MTDDEIDAVLDALIPDGTIIKRRDAGRLIYRAGMLEAAEILREIAPESADVDGPAAVLHVADVITLHATPDSIERAAGGER